jgi:hypothetical protein
MSEKAPAAVKYIGPDPCPVRFGDRAIAKDEIITGPQDVVAELAKRADFAPVEIKTEPEKKPAKAERKE